MLETLIFVANFLSELLAGKLIDLGIEQVRVKRIKVQINLKIKQALQDSIQSMPGWEYFGENFDISIFFQDLIVQKELLSLISPDDIQEPNLDVLQEIWHKKFGSRQGENYQIILSKFIRLLKTKLWEIKEIQSYLHFKESRILGNQLSDISKKLDGLSSDNTDEQKQNFNLAFSRRTQLSLEGISREIPGVSGPIYRKEFSEVEAKLQNDKLVLLIGDAGTGKSGIGASIAYARIQYKKKVLFIDARRTIELKTERELSDYFNLRVSVHEAIQSLNEYSQFSLIIDQLDNVAGSPSANLLIELACSCSKLKNVEIVVVSRDFEIDGNHTLVEYFMGKEFHAVEVGRLDKEDVLALLTQMGIDDFPEVVELAQNILNLRIIGKIKIEQPDFDFSMILDEAMLWDTYLDILMKEETQNYGSKQGKRLVQEAITLACESLRRDQRIFPLGFLLSDEQERLKSWGILREEGRGQYRFQHEKMQDYFYALYATGQRLLHPDVIRELGVRKAKNVFPFMDSLYEKRNPQLHIRFFREIMYVK
jgi:hypothetical protein